MSNTRTIIYNGKTINLSKCLKKDQRSYYQGQIFLKACEKEYAEFTCIAQGMIIQLTNTPKEDKYCSKGYQNGKYKIPNDLYKKYHLERGKSSRLYQLGENTYFLNGRLNACEKKAFKTPSIPNKTRLIYNEIDFEKLVNFGTNINKNIIDVKENGCYVVTYYNHGQQYISLKKAGSKEIQNLFSIRELGKIYGTHLKNFYGDKLSYIAKASGRKVYITKEFINRLGIDCSDCRVLYDPDKEIIYLTLPETFSDLSGEVIDPIKETPVEVVTEEATDMEMIQALLSEFTNFKESANKIFAEYKDLKIECQEIRAENEAIKKALKEQNKTVTINNGKAYFESFEEMTL